MFAVSLLIASVASTNPWGCPDECPTSKTCSGAELSKWDGCEERADGTFSCHCPNGNYMLVASDWCFDRDEYYQYCMEPITTSSTTTTPSTTTSTTTSTEDACSQGCWDYQECASTALAKLPCCKNVGGLFYCECENGYQPRFGENYCISKDHLAEIAATCVTKTTEEGSSDADLKTDSEESELAKHINLTSDINLVNNSTTSTTTSTTADACSQGCWDYQECASTALAKLPCCKNVGGLFYCECENGFQPRFGENYCISKDHLAEIAATCVTETTEEGSADVDVEKSESA